MASTSRHGPSLSNSKPRTCLCSPTTHPGSFRCSLHKQPKKPPAGAPARTPSKSNHHHQHHWEASMAAKADSLKVMKAILLQIIKPSSHDLHRRKNFQARPTRFCLMNNSHTDVVSVS